MKNSFAMSGMIITLLVVLLGLSGMIAIAVGCQTSVNPFDLVGKQFIRLFFGVVIMWIVGSTDFEKIKKASFVLAAFSLGLLYALPFFGTEINGMRGWFRYGDISFQPSEPGKAFFLLGLVLLLNSGKISRRSDAVKITVCGAYTLLWMTALLLQPDMGTAAIYAAAFLAVLYLGNIKLYYLAALIFCALSSAFFMIMTHSYALRRIVGFLNPEQDVLGKNWHLNQLLRAVARGGWSGVKSANAHWSKSYLPFSYNDSVFASVCESIGAFGAALIPAAFVLIFYLVIRESGKRELSFERQLFIKGAAFMLIFQSFLHISVNLGLLPVTGITMLFVSYGGSSMISGCLLLGIVFSALKVPEKK